MGMVLFLWLDVDIGNLENGMKAGATTAFDLHVYAEMQSFDDQSGEPLDPILVRKARMEEMEYGDLQGHRMRAHSGEMGRYE